MNKNIRENVENVQFQRGSKKKAEILEELRKRGCRITKQRETLIDIIMEEECACCKEIYYLAAKQMPGIGIATIYRMINVLEEIGALYRGNAYKICPRKELSMCKCVVELENHTRVNLSSQSLQEIIQKGMEACGYINGNRVEHVLVS